MLPPHHPEAEPEDGDMPATVQVRVANAVRGTTAAPEAILEPVPAPASDDEIKALVDERKFVLMSHATALPHRLATVKGQLAFSESPAAQSSDSPPRGKDTPGGRALFRPLPFRTRHLRSPPYWMRVPICACTDCSPSN